MKKLQGAIILVAGTCIGSGMIALPLVAAKAGLVPSILAMLFIWFVMYYTALINVELNLYAGQGLSLGELGKRFSGPIASSIGTLSLNLLSYSLLAVFIYGGTSIIKTITITTYSQEHIISLFATSAFTILLLPVKIIDYLNRILFIILLSVFVLLIGALTHHIKWSSLPLWSDNFTTWKIWSTIIPVLFTSFGFQVIFHTLTNYCNHNPRILKKAFFWGSLIPAIVYILWTSGVLSAVNNKSPVFYESMINGEVEVGDLILELSKIAQWTSLQILVWWVSLLAIITSVLGVGVGLVDALTHSLKHSILSFYTRKLIAVMLTVAPSYIVALMIPNAFISVLGFAGMILVVIAILLPIYLFNQLPTPRKTYYQFLKNKPLIWLMQIVGILIICSEILNILI